MPRILPPRELREWMLACTDGSGATRDVCGLPAVCLVSVSGFDGWSPVCPICNAFYSSRPGIVSRIWLPGELSESEKQRVQDEIDRHLRHGVAYLAVWWRPNSRRTVLRHERLA